MVYDPGKEKVVKAENEQISDGDVIVEAKVYTYGDNGKKKFKLLFSFESRGQRIYTSKFPPITSKEDIVAIRKLLQRFEKEDLG